MNLEYSSALAEKENSEKLISQEILMLFDEEQRKEVADELNSLKGWDEGSYDHSLRTSEMCLEMVKRLKLNISDKAKDVLVKSALVHDLGKTSIDQEILNSDVQIPKEQIAEVMGKHVEDGVSIAKNKLGLEKELPLIESHHNYTSPTGELTNEQLESIELLRIADEVDAMLSKRSYKEAFSVEKAQHEIIDEFKENTVLGLEKLYEVVDFLIKFRMQLNQE
ncbi:HD domain-containing protein [Patescibacteria group bacterium]|nr:HD domain-containing protein [Patescibacteria group bacterium]